MLTKSVNYEKWEREMGSELVDYLLSAQKQELEWEHATGSVHQWQKWVFIFRKK